jgi:hypothetical protein
MEPERRGRVKRSHDRGNWKQEDFDACGRQAVRLACIAERSHRTGLRQIQFADATGTAFSRAKPSRMKFLVGTGAHLMRGALPCPANI